MRVVLLWLSRRRFIGRFAKRLPFSRPMVARFVAGETLDAALPALERLRAAGFRTTVDILGEAVTSEAAARAAANAYVDRDPGPRGQASTSTSASSSARWASASARRWSARTSAGS